MIKRGGGACRLRRGVVVVGDGGADTVVVAGLGGAVVEGGASTRRYRSCTGGGSTGDSREKCTSGTSGGGTGRGTGKSTKTWQSIQYGLAHERYLGRYLGWRLHPCLGGGTAQWYRSCPLPRVAFSMKRYRPGDPGGSGQSCLEAPA
ncbi:hypothetical protein QYE76_039666 [Lolium multiflorum]|uniref:Uncharacterized protein n=1 Tax=Lolium multiflorum TaxID=4521 RepID=A0AAD8TBT8_LOLMU|nr:hypothetical protein QYE76_039666 [Lolium multiflorum]